MSKLVLIDGHSIINRAFYGIPDLTNSEGKHTNAVYGFLNIMFKILDEEHADRLIVAFDVKQPTFRHKMYEAYKGTRKPMPEELREQVPLLQDVLKAMNITIAMLPGYEADDVIGTLSRMGEEQGYEVTVVSGDRDLLQLAREHVLIRIPKTQRGTTHIENYYPEDVKNKYLVSPTGFIDVKALMGDTADNIPGVMSIGEKTATKLISTFGSLDEVYEHIDEVRPERIKNLLIEHKDTALLSRTLATINLNSPVDTDTDAAKIDNIFNSEAFNLMKELEFKSLLAKFDSCPQTNEIENHFIMVDELAKVQNIFDVSKTSDVTGIFPVVCNELIGVAICNNADEVYYIPAGGFISEEYIADQLMSIAAKCSRTVFINLKESLSVIPLEYSDNIYDIAIAGYLLNPLKDTYFYDDIARDYLNLLVPSRTELIGKLNYKDASVEKTEEFLKTVCYGAYIAFTSSGKLFDRLKAEGMKDLFSEIEMPTVFILNSMEKYGVRVDGAELKEYGEKLAGKIEECELSIYEQVGQKFNINSPKQLGEILFDKMKLPGAKKTKTGYSTSADVLDKLAPDYPVIKDILNYRQLTKLKSTYADGLSSYIREDGRIHGKFNQTITATGRLSSTEPNLQNIPIRMELGKQIRKVFVPEDGYVFVDADYSQIELRVLAHLSNDDNLIEAYHMAQDIHKITASKVFHTPFDKVTELQRRNAKAVNFGIVYGISSFGLSQDLSISRKDASEYIKQYFETYPGIKIFLDTTVKNAKKDGYVTTMFGRKRPVPELASSNYMQRSFGERIAMNSPIQGTAADIIKIAMIRVYNALKREKLKARLILQIHDELLIETPENELEQVKKIVAEEMKNAAHLKVALEVGIESGMNWLEAH